MTVLETARLRLEPWAPEHAVLLVRLSALPEVMRHVGAGIPWTRAEAEHHSARALVHWRSHGFGWRAAVERASGRPVGLIALNLAGPDVPELADDDHEIGWWIDPAAWGNGYATEGGGAIIEEAFVRLGAPSVVARIRPENVASVRVAAALGLLPERDAVCRFGMPVRILRLAAPGSNPPGAGERRLDDRRSTTISRSMEVLLPDGTRKELEDGATGADLAAAIGPGLARAALAVKVDGHLRDLARPLGDGERVEIVTDRSPESLELIRHDTAHVLAAAVLDLYPGTKISIGPPIEDGFYYDFEFPDGVTVSEHDLPALEERMREHVKAQEEFTREDIGADEALERFRALDQPYKVELIEDLVRDEGTDTVSLYTNGPFTDLCRGPHAPSTGRIKAFKLLSLAGAYWRGDATRQMLTRIYGTAFHSAKDLDAHLERLEQARARDHRKLGRELNLFMFSELSPGMPFWQPDGMVVWNGLAQLWRSENLARGYREVRTPILYDVDLWKQSGHWDKYRDNMYFTEVEAHPMGLKPMNCPAHIQLYKDVRRSYRDLPIRYSEMGLVHRHEPSGTLHGLLRVRHITQDDAHIFCTEEQIEDEVVDCLEFGFFLYRTFGFEPRLELSTRPDNRIGSDAMWDRAEAALERALRRENLEFEMNPGDGAFYGPKIDLHMTDSIGRSWQLGTVQLDYSMPERFEIAYTGADNAEHRPVMIHRALLGSFERFIGILIEHYAGEFPLWLSPLHALVLPVSDRHLDYANEVLARLEAAGLRARVDDRGESVGRKIRDAELAKVPYMLVVGDREAQSGAAALRRHREGDLGTSPVEEILVRLTEEAASGYTPSH